MKNIYLRKISREEADNGYIFVLKSMLGFFPGIGKEFQLKDGRCYRAAKVESYPCLCQGPDEPHEHFFISESGLKRGDVVEIRKIENDSKRYILKRLP
ncbi:MAG: hypothetical protein KGJ59_01655 [Bacteroidota bacterium]|nr:hypothetical protein [Bacteroidota bacterium]